MTDKIVISKIKGRLAVVTLNRPEAMNAINEELNREAGAILDDLVKNEDIDVIILTGAGKAFCAGLDLKEIVKRGRLGAVGPSMFSILRDTEKPTIAAVNGFAITGGFELALACDILVASNKAMFADTHARVGVLPGAGLSQVLPRIVGVKKAKELSLTGNFMTAQEAYQFGLVNQVVEPEELLPLAEKLAEDIISSDQRAVRKVKYIIDRGQSMSLADALIMEGEEHRRYLNPEAIQDVGRRRPDIIKRGRDQAREKG